MTQADSKVLPSPPSLVKTLLAGFDVISNHIELILFCIALDGILWLGPQIRLSILIQSVIDWISRNPDLQAPEMAGLMESNREALSLIAERLNLLTILRTFPVGISSLMIGRTPLENPFGVAAVWQVTSSLFAIVLFILLVLLGIYLGTLYFSAVSQAALQEKIKWLDLFKHSPGHYMQVVMLSFLWLGVLFAASIPLGCVLPIAFLSGSGIANFILVGYGILLIWVLLPLIFAPHGIFVNHSSMWESVLNSMRMTRYTLPSTGLFILAIILLSQGMDILWNFSENASWLTAIGLIGHAFVTTSLLAASFIYYRDANNWLQRMLQITKLSSMKA